MQKTVELNEVKLNGRRGEILRGLSFFAYAGQDVSLFGASELEKSSILRLISDLATLESGTKFVSSANVDSPASVAFVEYQSILPSNSTPNKLILRRLRNCRVPTAQRTSRMIEALDACSLMGVREVSIGALDQVEYVLTKLAIAVSVRPSILLLDNLTCVLPLPQRRVFESYLRQRRETGDLTVIRSTTSSDEACLSDIVALVGGGRVFDAGSPASLKTKYGNDTLTIEAADPAMVNLNLRGARNVEMTIESDKVVFEVKDGVTEAARLLRSPVGGIRVVTVQHPDLWEILLRAKAIANGRSLNEN